VDTFSDRNSHIIDKNVLNTKKLCDVMQLVGIEILKLYDICNSTRKLPNYAKNHRIPQGLTIGALHFTINFEMNVLQVQQLDEPIEG